MDKRLRGYYEFSYVPFKKYEYYYQSNNKTKIEYYSEHYSIFGYEHRILLQVMFDFVATAIEYDFNNIRCVDHDRNNIFLCC